MGGGFWGAKSGHEAVSLSLNHLATPVCFQEIESPIVQAVLKSTVFMKMSYTPNPPAFKVMGDRHVPLCLLILSFGIHNSPGTNLPGVPRSDYILTSAIIIAFYL